MRVWKLTTTHSEKDLGIYESQEAAMEKGMDHALDEYGRTPGGQPAGAETGGSDAASVGVQQLVRDPGHSVSSVPRSTDVFVKPTDDDLCSECNHPYFFHRHYYQKHESWCSMVYFGKKCHCCYFRAALAATEVPDATAE